MCLALLVRGGLRGSSLEGAAGREDNRNKNTTKDKKLITIEIILNPLGVPSRMNLGQMLETHSQI